MTEKQFAGLVRRMFDETCRIDEEKARALLQRILRILRRKKRRGRER